jgi:hypothetical protein
MNFIGRSKQKKIYSSLKKNWMQYEMDDDKDDEIDLYVMYLRLIKFIKTLRYLEIIIILMGVLMVILYIYMQRDIAACNDYYNKLIYNLTSCIKYTSKESGLIL